MNTSGTFMDKLRTFLGFRQEPPRNEFRNPIWGSDDDDDGDELYSRQNMDIYGEMDVHSEITRQMHDIFRSFGSMFGDMKSFFHDESSFFHDESFQQPVGDTQPQFEEFNSNSIRDYYLKSNYNRPEDFKDVDLDGKISSQEISGLLKKKDAPQFDADLVPGRSFCKTVITTSVTKADGTIETRKIVKSGNNVLEDTIISTPDTRGPHTPGLDIVSSGIIMSNLSPFFKNLY